MLLMILERCPTSLRGALSRYLIEPKAGVFLGNPSARIRDELWKMAIGKIKDGRVLQVWSDRCPQGYSWRSFGQSDREMIDLEGIGLVRYKRRTSSAEPKDAKSDGEDSA